LNNLLSYLLIYFTLILSCSSERLESETSYTPIPVNLNIPDVFQDRILPPVIPSNNPLTEEGIELGKKLFFDKKLSVNGSQSCADCHKPSNSFTDARQYSIGVDNIQGTRNSMPLFNLAWNYDDRFFWDGRELSLERQVLDPITNPIEMHNTVANLVQELQIDSEYPEMFLKAFGTEIIDSVLIGKAIAQYERTIISANSKFDKYLLGQTTLTIQEEEGFNIFMDEERGDCFHCHGNENNPLWTDNKFHNNGLDNNFSDLGLGAVTGNPNDNGKFKTPSLRNLEFTAPYMHDGRFSTIDEVINHYSEGLQDSQTVDPLMKMVSQGGVQLSFEEKANLKAFLLTLSDYDFISNPDFNQ
tara:strand:- start:74 stop:1144 length:1071 start_codon:yes stop_codon:yes gene_type:complete